MEARRPLPLLAFNHVSRTCTDLEASFRFYSEVLGFLPVKRPSAFDFEGAWLFNYGVGLHLIKGIPPKRSSTIEPKSCHISFQAGNLDTVESRLSQWGVSYIKNMFVEDGLQVGQLFFHDPDNNMIEVCNCDVLPVVPLTEGAFDFTAQPLTAAVVVDDSAPKSPPESPSSEAGTEESLPSSCGCEATSHMGGVSSRSEGHSFSNCGRSNATDHNAGSACNMSVCPGDLDEWPFPGRSSVSSSGMSVGVNGALQGFVTLGAEAEFANS